jgi:hypothetical protein
MNWALFSIAASFALFMMWIIWAANKECKRMNSNKRR